MERELSTKVLQMSNIVIRYIETAKKKAANYKSDALRYRGVVYKQLTK
jgi:hypothetical protein